MRTSIALCLIVSAASLGCSKSTPKPEPAATTSATPTVATAAASTPLAASAAEAPSAPVKVGPPPICKIESKKVWTSGVNKLAGLTEEEMSDGRLLIGLAVGNTPMVLSMNKGAQGRLIKATVKPGTTLSKPLAKGEGVRNVLRVTPVHVEGDEVHVFVDFRDDLKDKRRRVACGPADSDEWWVAFDGVPFLDRKDNTTDEVKNEAFKKDAAGVGHYHEIRDCRTFSDLNRNETWVLGSGLHGTMAADGTLSWKSTMFVDLGKQSHEKHLHEVELKGDKPKAQDYEVPVSRRLNDGSFLVATRNGGRLLVGILNADKSLRGSFASYGGFPTLPDMAEDGEDMIISTSLAKGKGEYGLRALRISQNNPVLPKGYQVVATDAEDQGSETDPDFTRDIKGRRWMAHIEGDRGKGQLSISPMDANFRVLGRAYAVTGEDEKASSARIVGMADGGIMVIYIRDTGELVTEEVHCTVSAN
jgi:hypothetical protein